MIQFDLDRSGQLVVKQEFKRPVIYLDHWAIRRFADEQTLGTRFVETLKSSNGTWAISLLNFMEFIKMEDEGQARRFEELMDLAIPNLFFIDFMPFDVIDREAAILSGAPRNAAYGDVSLLKTFADTKPDSPRPFTAKSLVTTIIKNCHQLESGLGEFQGTIMERLRHMRTQMLANKQLKKRVNGSSKSAVDRRTSLFVRELIGTLLRDNGHEKVLNDTNNAMDLLHAIVPVAYCDYVLLDAQWEHRVGEVRNRLRKHGVEIEPAKVFSQKRNGIDSFFINLCSTVLKGE